MSCLATERTPVNTGKPYFLMQLCNRINDNKRINNLCRSSLIITAHVIVIYLTYLYEVWHVNKRLQMAICTVTAYPGLLPLM